MNNNEHALPPTSGLITTSNEMINFSKKGINLNGNHFDEDDTIFALLTSLEKLIPVCIGIIDLVQNFRKYNSIFQMQSRFNFED